MEEVYRFPLLRLKPSDAPPPFVIPAFAGMTNKRACLGLNAQNSSKATHRFFLKNQKKQGVKNLFPVPHALSVFHHSPW